MNWPRTQKVKESPEWADIRDHYGEVRAARSQIPKIQHIEEGLRILEHIEASEAAMLAFCIHPLCQADVDLVNFNPNRYSGRIVMLAMEYRQTANSYLSRHPPKTQPKISPLKAVMDMLIADKVQNFKDFQANQTLYPNRIELDYYFRRWLNEFLGVSEAKHKKILEAIAQP